MTTNFRRIGTGEHFGFRVQFNRPEPTPFRVAQTAVRWLDDDSVQTWMEENRVGLWITAEDDGTVYGSVHPGRMGASPTKGGLSHLEMRVRAFVHALEEDHGYELRQLECGLRPVSTPGLVVVQVALTSEQAAPRSGNVPRGFVRLADHVSKYRLDADLDFSFQATLGRRVSGGYPSGVSTNTRDQSSAFLCFFRMSPEGMPALVEALGDSFDPEGYILRCDDQITVFEQHQ